MGWVEVEVFHMGSFCLFLLCTAENDRMFFIASSRSFVHGAPHLISRANLYDDVIALYFIQSRLGRISFPCMLQWRNGV